MDDPLLTMYVRTGPPYDPVAGDVPGRWRAEPAWPLADGADLTLHLDRGKLAGDAPETPDVRRWDGPWTVGTASPFWDLSAAGSTDTAVDDDRALAWETEPLDVPVEVLGRVEVTVTVEVDRPGGRLVAHLVDVAPDGTAAFVTRGVLNLSHRDDPGDPTVEPVAEPFEVTVSTVHTSAVFAPGHRIRVTLSGTDFPVVLPPPEPVLLTVHTGAGRAGRVVLPTVPVRPVDRDLAVPDATPPPPPGTWVRDVDRSSVERRGSTVRVSRRGRVDRGAARDRPAHLRVAAAHLGGRGRRRPDGPVRAGAVATTSLARAGWAVSATADTLLTVDAGSLRLAIDLACTHDGDPVWSDRVERVIPRRWT